MMLACYVLIHSAFASPDTVLADGPARVEGQAEVPELRGPSTGYKEAVAGYATSKHTVPVLVFLDEDARWSRIGQTTARALDLDVTQLKGRHDWMRIAVVDRLVIGEMTLLDVPVQISGDVGLTLASVNLPILTTDSESGDDAAKAAAKAIFDRSEQSPRDERRWARVLWRVGDMDASLEHWHKGGDGCAVALERGQRLREAGEVETGKKELDLAALEWLTWEAKTPRERRRGTMDRECASIVRVAGRDAQVTKGFVALRRGEWALAEGHFRQAIWSDPDPGLLLALAHTQAARGMDEAAWTILTRWHPPSRDGMSDVLSALQIARRMGREEDLVNLWTDKESTAIAILDGSAQRSGGVTLDQFAEQWMKTRDPRVIQTARARFPHRFFEWR